MEVLIENKLQDKPNFFGRNKFMTPVSIESTSCKPGDLVNVKITSFNQTRLFGSYQTSKIEAA
jgi:tRNA A37 methylthiotransferase MiaB